MRPTLGPLSDIGFDQNGYGANMLSLRGDHGATSHASPHHARVLNDGCCHDDKLIIFRRYMKAVELTSSGLVQKRAHWCECLGCSLM